MAKKKKGFFGKSRRPMASCGHGMPKSRSITPAQKRKVRKDGFCYVTVTLKGRKFKKRVTEDNLKGRTFYYYWRADSKTVCLRNFTRDAGLPKGRRATKYRPQVRKGKVMGHTGDSPRSRL